MDKESHAPQQKVERRQETFPRREHGSDAHRDTRRPEGNSFGRDTRPPRPPEAQPQRNPHNPSFDVAQKRTEQKVPPPVFDKPVLQTQDSDDFVPLTKTISLTELKPKPAVPSGLDHNTKKVPSQKNVNDLRQALASVAPKVDLPVSGTSDKHVPKPQPKESTPTPPPPSKQEVPEAVLKKILDMNQ